MPVRLAIVQFQISHLDRDKNLERIETFIRAAAQQEAQVIVFPEDCMTGSIFGDISRLDTTHATRDGFQRLAKTHAIDIVTGSSMEGGLEGNFNTSYYIDSTGRVLGTYRKNHLHPSEYDFLKAGTEALVFETAYGRAGIVICWDMLFPEIFQRLKAQGAEIVYCPSYWYKEVAGSLAHLNPNSEEQQLDALCITRSLETNCAIVYANAAGIQVYPNGTRDTLIGHSQIVMPALGPVLRVDHHDEHLFIQEIDLGLLKETKKIYQA